MTSNIVEGLRPLAVPIASLQEDAANAKIHDARSIDAIAGALKQFGQHKPLVVQAGTSIVRVGNGTLAAAKTLGWTEIAAVMVDESNVEATARAIADNRLSELAKFDDRALGLLLETIGGEAPDLLALTGFTTLESEDLIERLTSEPTEESKIPEREIVGSGDVNRVTRLVQLFVDEAGFIEFGKLIEDAKSRFGAPTVSDAVLAALRLVVARS